MSLANQTAWVVGGIGPVGRAITRSLLKQGANVIVNSRSGERLKKVYEDLEEHPRLITVRGSLLPGRAAETVNKTLSFSNVQLNHVVAHGAVRWWAKNGTGFSSMDESRMTVGDSSEFLQNDSDVFLSNSEQSLKLQFSAAQQLIPRLQASERPSTYTFVTGESGNSKIMRNPHVIIGSRALQGFAECVRQEVRSYPNVSSCEVRVGMPIDRPRNERERVPRDFPLSESVGNIVAGICANGGGGDDGVFHLDEQSDLEFLAGLFCEDSAGKVA
ncbi:hypothetical protein TrLO_g5535 [Triparma laevis f. longispina]|uniref:Uncharacterized protein n=1 Tax=Triparma laevis f. longispina TaxID=1714387 RepID=A0A9W7CFA9_9STRA|nr:hypothetical protein TrLO_g5535 [Triparma laevis f. longispina]